MDSSSHGFLPGLEKVCSDQRRRRTGRAGPSRDAASPCRTDPRAGRRPTYNVATNRDSTAPGRPRSARFLDELPAPMSRSRIQGGSGWAAAGRRRRPLRHLWESFGSRQHHALAATTPQANRARNIKAAHGDRRGGLKKASRPFAVRDAMPRFAKRSRRFTRDASFGGDHPARLSPAPSARRCDRRRPGGRNPRHRFDFTLDDRVFHRSSLRKSSRSTHNSPSAFEGRETRWGQFCRDEFYVSTALHASSQLFSSIGISPQASARFVHLLLAGPHLPSQLNCNLPLAVCITGLGPPLPFLLILSHSNDRRLVALVFDRGARALASERRTGSSSTLR